MGKLAKCLTTQQMTAFRSGKFSPDEQDAVAEHVQVCEKCRAGLQTLEENERRGRKISGNGETTTGLEMGTEAGFRTPDGPPASAPEKSAEKPRHSFLGPAKEKGDLGVLGKFRVAAVLGEGGMGTVFKGIDTVLNRPVALKVMQPHIAEMENAKKRFLLEARAMAAISSGHVVTVHDIGEVNGVLFLAMEFLKGESLERWQTRGQVPPVREILRVAREIAEGLAAAHAQGLVHRDLKPSNLWIESNTKRIKILDFGLAFALSRDVRLTQTGFVLGTPHFMSPEQAHGAEVDARSDLFSLGSVLYQLCTRSLPFDGESALSVVTKVATVDPPAVELLNPDIPQPICELVTALMSKRREDRPASAREVVERIRQIERSLAEGPKQAKSAPPPAEIPKFTKIKKQKKQTEKQSLFQQRSVIVGLIVAAAFITSLAAVTLVRSLGGRPADKQAKAAKTEPEPMPDPDPVPTPAPVKKTEPIAVPKKTEPKLVDTTPKKVEFELIGEPRVVPDPKPPDPKLIEPEAKKFYLTEMKPAAQSNWPFRPPAIPPGMPPPGGKKPPDEFQKIIVGGKEFSKGLFIHPPVPTGGPASVSYTLNKEYSTFQSHVTINDTAPSSMSPMTFNVYGDGKLLWQSKPVTTRTQGQDCKIAVKGVKILKVEATTKDPRGAHAVWLDPYLEK